MTEPMDYLYFLHLMEHAVAVVTDSGGIREVATYLQVPCLTVRETTERPATVEMGTNDLVPLNPGLIPDQVARILADGRLSGQVPSHMGRTDRSQVRSSRTGAGIMTKVRAA